MGDVQPLLVEDENGNTYTIYVETKTPIELPPELPRPGEIDQDDRESYGLGDEVITKIEEVHESIRTYTWYAIGAFKSLQDIEVEEVCLKFGLKIGGKTGIPILTEGSAEANFEIQVKCKLPKK